jgi:hypothetical protein
MHISSLSGNAVTHTNRTSATSGTDSTQRTQGHRPPPPDDGGGFVGAIADALKSIGVDDTTTSADTAGTGATASTSNAAQALGSFLENLMGALHARNGGSETPPAYGEAPQGGPGKLSSDLQSLISQLDSDGTDTGDSTVGALQGSFKDLLGALGTGTDDADTRLASFLQALSSKLPSAGSSGNLVDTTA